MKKINKKYIQLGLIALFVICISLGFDHFLDNLSLPDGANLEIGKILLPIIDGCGLAYFLNPLMVKIEKKIVTPVFLKLKLKCDHKNSKRIRGISITITLIIFLWIIAGLILMIVPQLLDSVQSIIT
ncbi:MAG: hypothetical protein K6E98_02355, partial [Lachnospiraceae bacterium]|nr:hypothetical protein [Lachnospiraceae bacterium]